MKRVIHFFVVLLLTIGPASVWASWTDDFREDFDRNGIDVAVENALENGVEVRDILIYTLSNDEFFQTGVVLVSLYCAGADQDAVKEAADRLGISSREVEKALEQSIEECGSKMPMADRDIIGSLPPEPHGWGAKAI